MRREFFPLVDDTGNVIGKASREECHSGSFLLHPVVHLHVFNSKGELYLQLRAKNKDTQPDKWDTSVGGHVDFGEEVIDALIREAKEELGMSHFKPIFIQSYKFTSEIESELVNSFYTLYDNKLSPCPVETQGGRFWSIKEILENFGKGVFTPNFEQEFEKINLKQLADSL